MDATFRPINHAYVHSSASGSGDSCPKPDMRSSDSNTDNSRPNTGHYSYGNLQWAWHCFCLTNILITGLCWLQNGLWRLQQYVFLMCVPIPSSCTKCNIYGVFLFKRYLVTLFVKKHLGMFLMHSWNYIFNHFPVLLTLGTFSITLIYCELQTFVSDINPDIGWLSLLISQNFLNIIFHKQPFACYILPPFIQSMTQMNLGSLFGLEIVQCKPATTGVQLIWWDLT